MKKLNVIAAIAASTLALGGTMAATTANAQGWHHGYSDSRYSDSRLMTPYVSGLDWKITNAARSGRISWAEARQLRQEAHDIQPLSWRYQNGTARPWEVRRLEEVVSRIDGLTQGYAYNQHRDWR